MKESEIGHVESLINHLQTAYNKMGLVEANALTPDELLHFSKDNSFSLFKKKYHFDATNTKQAKEMVSKILDYYLFTVSPAVIKTLRANINAYTTAGRLYYLDQTITKMGAYDLYEYLQRLDSSKLFDDKKLYKKILWLEWGMFRFLRFVSVEKQINDSNFGISLTEYGLWYQKKLNELIRKFEEKTSFDDINVFSFRLVYPHDSLKESFDGSLKALKNEASTEAKIASPKAVIKKDETMNGNTSVPVSAVLQDNGKHGSSIPAVKAEAPQQVASSASQSTSMLYNKYFFTESDEDVSTADDPVQQTAEQSVQSVRAQYWMTDAHIAALVRDAEDTKLMALKTATYNYQQYLKGYFSQEELEFFEADSRQKRKRPDSLDDKLDIRLKLSLTGRLMDTKSVEAFKDEFKVIAPQLQSRRDSGTITFLKVIASILCVATVVLSPVLFSIWRVQGKEASKQIKSTLKQSFQP